MNQDTRNTPYNGHNGYNRYNRYNGDVLEDPWDLNLGKARSHERGWRKEMQLCPARFLSYPKLAEKSLHPYVVDGLVPLVLVLI